MKCSVTGEVKVPWSRVLSFNDPFLCQTAVQGGKVEILPTTRGAFRAELTQIGMNRVWMQRFDLAQPLVSTVAANVDRKVIGFLADDGSPQLQHCGLEVAPHHMLVYGKDVLHQRSQRAVQYATMSVPAGEFPTLCRTIIGREFLEGPNFSALSPDPSLMSRLVKLHRSRAACPRSTGCIADAGSASGARERFGLHFGALLCIGRRNRIQRRRSAPQIDHASFRGIS